MGAASIPSGVPIMPNRTDLAETPKLDGEPSSEIPVPLEERKKLDSIAETAAEKASKTEQRFDRDHNIFTK
jgi:hypothetical protein